LGWKGTLKVIQIKQEQDESPEHLKYIGEVIVWGNAEEEMSEKGKK